MILMIVQCSCGTWINPRTKKGQSHREHYDKLKPLNIKYVSRKEMKILNNDLR